MCGIWLHLIKKGFKSMLSNGEIYEAFMKIQKRGPDQSVLIKPDEKYGLSIGFHRLAINGLSLSGDQPFTYETDDKIYYLVCNGEIYNHKKLEKKYGITPTSGSDCEVLLHLWLKIGMDEMSKELDAEYAVCVCELDKTTNEVKLYISRDHLGIRPLYVSGNKNEVVITSDLNGSPFLLKNTEGYNKVHQFKPRCNATLSNMQESMYDLNYTQYIDFNDVNTTIYDLETAMLKINRTLRKAVTTRLMSDKQVGALLSGGLDSSLVCAIASEYLKKQGKTLKTFSIGLNGGTDEFYAKKVAEYIGSDHTHVEFTNKEFLDSLNIVIKTINSFDITTVRASVGQYLISKWVFENSDIKVLLLGDISDELVSGYMYNFSAPSSEDLHAEAVRLLNDIHFYDGLRADRSVASNSLEGRFPFGFLKFVKLYLSIDPKFRMPTFGGIEKWLLRESFKADAILPNDVLFRIKTAFSDGVSSEEKSWFQIIQEHLETDISNEEFEEEIKEYNHMKPVSKEALYFRRIFESHFGTSEETAKVVPYFWLPKWSGGITEPSARVLQVYKEKMNITE